MKSHFLNSALFTALFALTSAFPLSVHADTKTPLEDLMGEVYDQVKAVGGQLEDRDSNKDSEARALKMRQLFIAAFQFVPKKVEEMKAEERPSFMRAYDKFLAREIALTSDLEGFFAANENDKAKETFTEIGKVQREAHTLLKKK